MGRVKKKKNQEKRALSLKQAFMMYLFFGVLVEILLLAVTFQGMSKAVTYANDYEESDSIVLHNGIEMKVSVSTEQTTGQKIIVRLVHIGSVAFPILYSVATLFITAKLYYNRRLAPALERLETSAHRIAESDLDFTVEPVRNDELGELCKSFEAMRTALDHNNQKMWRVMEERKRLNAAFAHDLRTPLTVLRGYSDYLISYYPAGKLSGEKLLSTLQVMERHIQRLQSYVDTMNQVEALETIRIKPAETEVARLVQAVRDVGTALNEKERSVEVRSFLKEPTVFVDEPVVLRVAENLISNSMRYARDLITVKLCQEGNDFLLEVRDDGDGFDAVSLKDAARPYYKDSGERGAGHMGMGLHICSLLCQRHGGRLELQNHADGGAQIKAYFCMDDIEDLPQITG